MEVSLTNDGPVTFMLDSKKGDVERPAVAPANASPTPKQAAKGKGEKGAKPPAASSMAPAPAVEPTKSTAPPGDGAAQP